jgi:hypothetical protein
MLAAQVTVRPTLPVRLSSASAAILTYAQTPKAIRSARRLRDNGLKPMECSFEFLALGPLFPEQQTTEQHRSFRDRTGALEALLTNELRDRVYEVIGIHASRGKPTAADAVHLHSSTNSQLKNESADPDR